MEPAEALERIVYLLDRAREKPYRVRAYLRAAQIVKALAPDELVARVAARTLEELDGIGPKTAAKRRPPSPSARAMSSYRS